MTVSVRVWLVGAVESPACPAAIVPEIVCVFSVRPAPVPPAPPSQAYTARGQEPGWSLTIANGRIDYAGNYGEKRITVPAPEPRTTFNGHRYETQRLIVDITHGIRRHAVAEGASYLSPRIAHRVITRLRDGSMSRDLRARDRVAALTPRERDVLALIGEGLSNEAIGRRLHLSAGTVKAHVSAILQRLEDALGLPVVSSNSAMVWHLLSQLKLQYSVGRHGRLLREWPAPR